MTSEEQRTIDKLSQLLKKEYQYEGSGHDWSHIERVWKLAKKLSRNRKVNQFVVEAAALLHDVDDYKFKKEGEGEFSHIEQLLDQHGITGQNRTHVLDIVSHVSFKGAGVPTIQKTLEGQIVQDADRLEALGAIGIARTCAYSGYKGYSIYDASMKLRKGDSFETYKKGKTTAINHFYEKLLLIKDRLNTKEAKQMAARRHRFLETFLQEFFQDLKEAS